MASQIQASAIRLRKHADYQRVYTSSRKQFSKQMSYFFTVRPENGQDGRALVCVAPHLPRVGLTVGKVMGKAVDRNRIKRRMRAVIRENIKLLREPVDVVLHPRRSVIDLDFSLLRQEMATVFQSIQRQLERSRKSPLDTATTGSRSKKDRSVLPGQSATGQAGR